MAKSCIVVLWLILGGLGFAGVSAGQTCGVFPADNIWNTPVDKLPVDPRSATYVNTIGSGRTLHPDFGSGEWPPGSGAPIGIPYVTVPGTQRKVKVSFDYWEESDSGSYPIPSNAPIEGGSQGDGDRHILVIDRDNCLLYELFYAFPQTDGSWHAASGAIFDLKSNKLRPSGWTSADAAGLPIYPGLVRYDEVASGEIRHALRFTVPQTRKAFVWPARHYASTLTGTQYPPMGQRFRLKAGFDISGFSPQAQVILRALKRYGMILADNGSAWYISGAPDPRWNDDVLQELKSVAGSNFEAVDVSSLMVSSDSAAVKSSAGASRTIVDNGQSGTSSSGTWSPSSGPNAYGGTSLYSAAVGSIYEYRASVSGTVPVYLWWTTMSSRCTNVQVRIYSGSTLLATRTVNQQSNGGRWNLLGNYAFGGTARVRVTAPSGCTTCADAVRFGQ